MTTFYDKMKSDDELIKSLAQTFGYTESKMKENLTYKEPKKGYDLKCGEDVKCIDEEKAKDYYNLNYYVKDGINVVKMEMSSETSKTIKPTQETQENKTNEESKEINEPDV